MELRIDGRRCDLGRTGAAAPGYDALRTRDLGACREGRSLRIAVPRSATNDPIAEFAADPHAAERFNASLHRAELRAGGATLLAGTVRLTKTTETEYEFEIRDGGADWARRAARGTLQTLGIDYSAALTPTTICASWSDASPVKFFPIHRDEYPQRNGGEDLLPAERMLSVDDYHPFLHVATLIERIFAEAGYTLRSDFFGSEFFRSLYMSGAYASRDTTAADNRMGFFARRLSEASATADDIGRVLADPKAPAHTVGNLVESATPQTLDADGEPIPELRNNGGCFSIAEGKIRFTPPTEVNVGFEHYFRYTTEHRIRSRTRLTGFDEIYLGPGAGISFALANRYEDRRTAITTGFVYRIVVFDHADGARYRLRYTRDGSAGALWTEFAARSAQIATPASGTVTDPVLETLRDGAWIPYAGDWALYDGHIGETGETTVELRVRTASRTFSPASPARFDLIYFGGAEPGMRLTLHKECSLRPRFLAGPGFGSQIGFADVARHGFRQSELLEALGHLFNLRFYTDEAIRTVFVEPADDFYRGPEADWSDRTDFAQPIESVDLALGLHERRTWCYREGDGTVKRFDAEAEAAGEGPLGAWSRTTDSYAAKEGVEVLRNPLFRPSLSAAGHYLNAPSALLLQVGDRDAAEEEGMEEAPRLVRYAGLHDLPDGQRWGHPWNRASYPLAAFHFAGDDRTRPFTLGFEDRDGATGLHRHYDRQAERESERQRIVLSLRIEPHEFETLLAPYTEAPSIRSVFRIDTGAGVVRATLEKIDDYDPAAASVRCTFIRLSEP